MTTPLPTVIAAHVAAVNAGDLDALAATFAADAFVTAQGQARGTDAVRVLLAEEFIDDQVRLEVRDVIDHHGDFILRLEYDGNYDKTNLPDPLVMTSYFSLRGNDIITLAVISTPPFDATAAE
jgi:hypothetical protein